MGSLSNPKLIICHQREFGQPLLAFFCPLLHESLPPIFRVTDQISRPLLRCAGQTKPNILRSQASLPCGPPATRIGHARGLHRYQLTCKSETA